MGIWVWSRHLGFLVFKLGQHTPLCQFIVVSVYACSTQSPSFVCLGPQYLFPPSSDGPRIPEESPRLTAEPQIYLQDPLRLFSCAAGPVTLPSQPWSCGTDPDRNCRCGSPEDPLHCKYFLNKNLCGVRSCLAQRSGDWCPTTPHPANSLFNISFVTWLAI